MKKIYYILFLSLTGFCFNSCVSEEEDLFEKSAAERMNEALSEYKAILQDDPQGWVMEFYPGDLSMGGYTYTAKFDNGKVDMTSELSLRDNITGDKLSAGTVKTSYYQVISEQSVVLTFDTYNLLFHFFSEPRGSSDVDGYASDYEFVFMEVSKDRIVLKGKKYGNKLVMTKLTEDAESYIQGVLDMRKKLEAVPRTKMSVEGKEYQVSMGSKQLSCTDVKEDGSLENFVMSYIYTPDGINLYEPLTINGVTFQHFVYNDATGVIETTDAKVSFPYPTALEQFCGTISEWNFTFDLEAKTGEMNEELIEILSTANNDDYDVWEENIVSWYIGANSVYPVQDPNPFCMGWLSSSGLFPYTIVYGYEMSIVDEASKTISLQSTAPGFNFDYYEHLSPIVEYIDKHSPYTVEFDDERTPSTAKFISTVDNKVWFKVIKQ